MLEEDPEGTGAEAGVLCGSLSVREGSAVGGAGGAATARGTKLARPRVDWHGRPGCAQLERCTGAEPLVLAVRACRMVR